MSKTLWILLIIGGINWGLVGLGGFIGSDLNIISLIFGSMEALEWIVYIIVGISAVLMIFGCRCKKCKGGSCSTCDSSDMSQDAHSEQM